MKQKMIAVFLLPTLILSGCGSQERSEPDTLQSPVPFVASPVSENAATLQGDVNADGSFDIQDIIMVQNWLLAKPDATLTDWRAADVCQDERIDVFELCLLKRMLLYPASDHTDLPPIKAGEAAPEKSQYTDSNGDTAAIPAEFKVSEKEDEQTISQGLVVIAPDGSEYVWVPTTVTALERHDFGSYFSGGGSLDSYYDETDLPVYQAMADSVKQYGGFYIGRFEASRGDDGLPASKRITDSNSGKIWVQFSPQDTTLICEQLYANNNSVQGFFPWGVTWDTTLEWLIDSGCKTETEVVSDSTGWGNYSNDTFSEGANGRLTGQWEEAKANNIYDLAGNNWEWTQERCGSSYVMRGGGYNLMGGSCPGDRYPAALRDPLPGNNHHPNVTFRTALYVK